MRLNDIQSRMREAGVFVARNRIIAHTNIDLVLSGKAGVKHSANQIEVFVQDFSQWFRELYHELFNSDQSESKWFDSEQMEDSISGLVNRLQATGNLESV